MALSKTTSFLWFLLTLSSAVAINVGRRSESCERITSVPMCDDTPYNMTRMPNMQGHQDQAQAAAAMTDFKPLVDTSCSPHLKFFLCSVFTPMCTDTVDVAITSCRSVCEEVKRACLPLLSSFGLPWPEVLHCSKFQEDKGGLCMQPFQDDQRSHGAGTNRDHSPGGDARTDHSGALANYAHGYDNPNLHSAYAFENARRNCLLDFIPLDGSDKHPVCALSCHRDIMFQRKDKEFAEVWMTVWASLCFAVTGFVVLTFILDVSRFPYPVRPVIFISLCYNLYSLGYIVRLVLHSEQVSCAPDKHGCKYLIQGGLESSECVIVFLLLYYFSISSSVWWVVLTVTWFMASVPKWAAEVIEKYSSFFHLVAWGLPAILCLAVLITKRLDASELTGLCFVGNNDSVTLVVFVIIPLSMTLVIGSGFLVVGLVYACKIRNELVQRNLLEQSAQPLQGSASEAAAAKRRKDVQSMEKLVVRLGVFAVLYMVPAICVLACSFYEKWLIDLWSASKSNCLPNSRIPRPSVYPRVEVFMLKIFMCLVVGVTGGIWIWSKKTLQTWSRIFCLRCHSSAQKAPPREYQPVPSSMRTDLTTAYNNSSGGTRMVSNAASNNAYCTKQYYNPYLSHSTLTSSFRRSCDAQGYARAPHPSVANSSYVSQSQVSQM